MDRLVGHYRAFRIYEVEYVPGQPSGEFRVDALIGPTFSSMAAAQRAIDEMLAELEAEPAPASPGSGCKP